MPLLILFSGLVENFCRIYTCQPQRGTFPRSRSTDPKVQSYSQTPLVVKHFLLEQFGENQSAQVTLRKSTESAISPQGFVPTCKTGLAIVEKTVFTRINSGNHSCP